MQQNRTSETRCPHMPYIESHLSYSNLAICAAPLNCQNAMWAKQVAIEEKLNISHDLRCARVVQKDKVIRHLIMFQDARRSQGQQANIHTFCCHQGPNPLGVRRVVIDWSNEWAVTNWCWTTKGAMAKREAASLPLVSIQAIGWYVWWQGASWSQGWYQSYNCMGKGGLILPYST